eukprot:scaffold66031_cov35-Phaeocystis_antarctica.AAC.1
MRQRTTFGIIPGGSEEVTHARLLLPTAYYPLTTCCLLPTHHLLLATSSYCVALHASGRENLYLRHRAGFIKYALRHGYTLVIAFSFGESDP